MKRTAFRPRWRRQNAGQNWQKVYTRTRIYLSFPLLEDPLSVLLLFFFSFFLERKLHNSIASSCRERETEGARAWPFFFLTLSVCHHSGRQRQKQAADIDRSMTSRNQLIAQQRNDFRPRQLRCSLSARLSASRSEVHIDEELTLKFKTLRHRRDEPYKTKDIQHQRPLLGVQHRQDERAPMPRLCELWRSAPGTSAHHGKRRVVCQPNFGWQLWKRNGYICVYFNWPPGPNPVVAISTRVGPGSRLLRLGASPALFHASTSAIFVAMTLQASDGPRPGPEDARRGDRASRFSWRLFSLSSRWMWVFRCRSIALARILGAEVHCSREVYMIHR